MIFITNTHDFLREFPPTTLPETNIFALENGWSEYYFPIGARPIFRGENVSFRECTLSHYTPPLEHVVVTELLQEMGCCEAATQPSNNNNNNNKKSPGNHSSQHVEDPITKKHCTKYHLTGDSTKNTSTPFSTPQNMDT